MILSFKHAAVALDLSEASDLIIDYLNYFKDFDTTKITLVSVVSIPHTSERFEINTDQKREKLESYKKKLEEQGFEVDIDLRVGTHFYPPTEILSSADEHGASFVVIGNRGQSKVQELLLGSTATELLQRSELPVFLLNMNIELISDSPEGRRLVLPDEANNALKHVLHPTDFSETAFRAFEVLKHLDSGKKFEKVSFIHVQGPNAIALKDPVSLKELNEKNSEQLNKMRNQLSDKTRNDSDIFITFGPPAKEIIKTVEEQGITMIIMGSQGKGFVHEFFIGGVSSQVTRFSNVPVLLVPAERN